jgi:protoporphyrinogen oxidase
VIVALTFSPPEGLPSMSAPDCGTVICIGAGPAGLTAAYLLSRRGVPVTVLERDPALVGGISRTASYRGFLFDIGGHRFFSKSREVEDLWSEILGPDFLTRPRKSRIYYRGQLFDYPLRARDALAKLGLVESIRCVASYAWARLSPRTPPRNFEDWVTNRFGVRLFRIFFQTYTEKVWGMKCTEISADWAAQRIKGLSLSAAIWNAVFPQGNRTPRGQVIKTLIDSFRYPRKGPGMMWEAAAAKVRQQGGQVLMGHAVTQCALDAGTRRWTVTTVDGDGRERAFAADHVVSSMAVRDLVRGVQPEPPAAIRAAAEGLRYRDFLVVALIVRDRGLFDDNWIYIHEPGVKVGRIQNFKSWSPEMVPDPAANCLGMEYFCFEGDGLWSMPDLDLIALARREIAQLGLVDAEDVLDGHVIRQPKAYPVYDQHHDKRLQTIRSEIEEAYPNLHLVGRNGMHRYNNQDHAMMTAMLTVENILAGRTLYNVWNVNEDAEYHEAGEAASRTMVPAPAVR